ncbi:protein RER1-like [Uloborus diversus]|uniref:protein RER1-like n=1 Tax=Uloborus diversus TaxID=327109 RepID=UPI002409B06A|nr:protein RER1-like [Uloborus diversus]XP_054724623.1 protein RER1-like [Uloborus diversus]
MAAPPIEIKTEDISVEETSDKSSIIKFCQWLSQLHQHMLDTWTPFIFSRWTTTALVLIIYLIRVFYLKGWFIITYALGIYHLSLFIAFLSPKIDPAHEGYDDGLELPMTVNKEFKPFIRRLPEFKFWYSATRAIFVAMFCTFFDFFNIPVFWPILLLYFILLTFVTLKRQIMHMITYRYLPWTHGKVTYRGKEDSGKIVTT